jgi:hypothetical protein
MESDSGCGADNVEFTNNTANSLLREYAALVPAGMHEVGYDITEKEDGVVIRRVTHWYIGEVCDEC